MHCVKLMCMSVEYLVDVLCKTNVYVWSTWWMHYVKLMCMSVEYLVDALCKANVYISGVPSRCTL